MIQFDSYFSDGWFNRQLDNVKALDFSIFGRLLKQGKFHTVADVESRVADIGSQWLDLSRQQIISLGIFHAQEVPW